MNKFVLGQKDLPLVAIVGLPNVGKSTLFNKLIGEKKSVVTDIPGTTRDNVVGVTSWCGKELIVVDTAGFFGEMGAEDMKVAVERQIETALNEAEVIIWLNDGRRQQSENDSLVYRMLKRRMDKVVVVVNKVDSPSVENQVKENATGVLRDSIMISSANGRGIGDMLDKVMEKLKNISVKKYKKEDALNVCIVGRPNVGKSTLINSLCGYERMVVSCLPGTTRDVGEIVMNYHGKKICFFDTAGARRNGVLANNELEKYSWLRALVAMRKSDVIVVEVDVTHDLGRLDLSMMELAGEMGKGMVIFANKSDVWPAQGREYEQDQFMKQLRKRAIFVYWVPVVFGSAKNKINIKALLKKIVQTGENYACEIKQEYLDKMIEDNMVKNTRLNSLGIRKMTQIGIRPPVFRIKLSRRKKLNNQEKRMMENLVRDSMGLYGVTVRIID